METSVLGPVSTNCYFIYNEESREAIIVDPADNSIFIINKCQEMDINPVAILLTHGHFDHITAAEDVRKAFGIPIYAGEAEKDLLHGSNGNLSRLAVKPVSLTADIWLEDADVLDLAGFSIEVITTPGHTVGSVCYYIKEEDVLMSGDTLFLESVGRTDFPTSSTSAIIHSIKEKLFTLPEETDVYPGHDDKTTIAHEKKFNPVASL